MRCVLVYGNNLLISTPFDPTHSTSACQRHACLYVMYTEYLGMSRVVRHIHTPFEKAHVDDITRVHLSTDWLNWPTFSCQDVVVLSLDPWLFCFDVLPSYLLCKIPISACVNFLRRLKCIANSNMECTSPLQGRRRPYWSNYWLKQIKGGNRTDLYQPPAGKRFF